MRMCVFLLAGLLALAGLPRSCVALRHRNTGSVSTSSKLLEGTPTDGLSKCDMANAIDEQPNALRGYFFMACLALQFGLQPLFTQTCIDKDAHKPTLVLLCEVLKCIFAVTLLFLDGGASGRAAVKTWSMGMALKCAGVPAAVYAFQNVCIQMAYQNMDPIIFNLLNQNLDLDLVQSSGNRIFLGTNGVGK